MPWFSLVKLILMVVSTTESVDHSREGYRGVVRSSCEAVVHVSLPALHLDSRRECLIHRFDKTVSSLAQLSTLLFLTSPARCSCDLRALCTAWWEEVTRSQEQGMLSCPCNVGNFVQSLLIFSRYIFCSVSKKKNSRAETYSSINSGTS